MIHSRTKFPRSALLAALLLIFLATACGPLRNNCKTPKLASVMTIDSEGMSETTSNPDRLRFYENIDFLCPQQYQKVLRVYCRDEAGNIPAYITTYHPNGQVRQYVELFNGRAFGCYKEWYTNGCLKVSAALVGGEPDTTPLAEKSWIFDNVCTVWDEDGNRIAEIPYCKGDLQGISLYYHANDKLWKSCPYDRNLAHGTHEIYLDNGNLLQTVEYKRGQRDGTSVRYWDNGQISSAELYCDGKLIQGEYFDTCGKPLSDIVQGSGYRTLFGKESVAELQQYNEGIQDGEVKLYTRGGRLARLHHVKNGLKHGEEIEFYDKMDSSQKPIPKLSVNWYEARIQGVVKTWYPTGVQESQREMSSNKKNGLSRAWYKDGSLMLIEEYDQDKLMRGEYFKKGEKSPISVINFGKGITTLYDSEGNFVRRIHYENGIPID